MLSVSTHRQQRPLLTLVGVGCAWGVILTPYVCGRGASHGTSGCAPACVEEGRSWHKLAKKLGEQGAGSRAWGCCSRKAVG